MMRKARKADDITSASYIIKKIPVKVNRLPLAFCVCLGYTVYMFKIWLKTNKDKKIVTNELIFYEGKYDPDEFDEYVRYACHETDIPTPVILSSHAASFTKYNIARFKPADFVEHVDFDELTLENVKI